MPGPNERPTRAQTVKPPPKFKKKAAFFLKTVAGKLDNDSIKKVVITGEISENPLETLAVVAQDVFMPMLTSAANQQGWPDVVAKEVTENLHKFVANGVRMGHAAHGHDALGWDAHGRDAHGHAYGHAHGHAHGPHEDVPTGS